MAKDMLSHAIPSGDEAAILDRALTLLLEDLDRKKFAASDHPRPGRPALEGSRHVPAEVKRAVWARDSGRCGFIGAGGQRCTERRFLEFHHLRPWGIGGESTIANIGLRCAMHNQHEARLFFARDDGSEVAGEAPLSYGDESWVPPCWFQNELGASPVE